MKDLGCSYLIWRMGPLLKHCSILTSNRTALDLQQRLLSVSHSLREGGFPREHLVGEREWELTGVIGGLGCIHALECFHRPHGCDSPCLSPSISSYSL